MRLDPTEAEEAQCDAMISLAVDGSRCLARFPVVDPILSGYPRCSMGLVYLPIQ